MELTEKQLRAHLTRDQANGGHGIPRKELQPARLDAQHVKDHREWPHLLAQDEGHEHPTEG